MSKRRIMKMTIAFLCILSIMMPYMTPVFAKALTHEDAVINLETTIIHEGGDEATGNLPEEYSGFYDVNPYGYKIGDTRIFKIIVSGDVDFENALYCLNGDKSFPGTDSLEYKNVADLKNDMDPNVKKLGLSAANYKALIWLINNMYLRHQAPEQKDEFLANAFNVEIGSDEFYTVKTLLTDDDIEIVQQWAMWNFTNSETEKYTSFGAVTLNDYINNNEGSFGDVTGSQERQDYARDLYNYLVKSAKEAKEVDSVKFPSIVKNEVKSEVDGEYYKVGPFKVTSGTAMSESYRIKLLDSKDVEIPREAYNIKIDGEDGFSEKNVNQIFDKNYYIYIPIKDNGITKIKLNLDYTTYETKATLWETVEAKYQPVTLITREKTPHNEYVEVNIEQKQYDLALRKYIVKVNNTEYTNRNPKVDVTPLKNGEQTAIYKHPKAPIEVKAGDIVTYEIRVYNEGDINASLTTVVDYLPEGLEIVEDSEINQNYGWTVSEDDRVATTNYLENQMLKAFDKNSDTLDSKELRIECKISENVDAGKVLTNIAEILEDNIDDRDSIPGNIEIEKIDTETFSGDKNNDTDLTKDEYYKGIEDDDDFEKVKVKGGFDLSLQKFITKANGKAPTVDRTPVVDVTPLKNGTKTNANYKTVKTPLVVKKGDVIIYTIRVYNEGEIAGYAEEVADYLPEGLGFLVNHTVNIDNYWSISEMSESKKLSQIPNGKDNLKIEDFSEIDNLDEVTVVTGKVKLLSTKLKSSNTDTENLIKEFDKVNGTKLDYKDIQVACIVLDDIPQGNSLRNVAEITKNSNENREDVKDIDSTPDTVDPDNYPGDDKEQDDNDYELLVPEAPKKFDLALQKFITRLNDNNITDRVPKVSIQDGKISYEHKDTSLPVANGELVTYTIRVYNEGEADGYAAEVADNLPDGLTFVADNDINKQYGWKLYDKNGKETSDLKQAVSVKTDYLSKEKSEARNENCLIKAFDTNKGITATNPDYRDVVLVLKVETEASNKNDIINVAEITDDTDKDGNPVDDVDSVPGNNKKDEDDIDEEKVRLQEFDLSLQKFITRLNNNEIKDRIPTITKNEDGTLRFNHSTESLPVANNDVITYTIRVYNEGDVPGYAKEVLDDLPKGLTFITDNDTNKKYGWKLYDENGKETSDLSKAKTVRTDYLSKEKSELRKEDCLLKAFDGKGDISNTNPDYRDLQIVFKVNEADIGKDKSKREIINTAEISDDTDKDGNPVDDKDSVPGNNKDGEDDIDREKVYVKYFDLSLQKDLVKAIIVEDGKTREVVATPNQLLKIEIHRKKIASTTVKFVYNITVKNEGEIAGYATQLKDYIPDGLEFIPEDNKHWTKESDKVVTTEALKDTLLEPGKTASTQITLKWTNAENNMGEKVNIAEISQDKNDSNSPDIDSTPNNKVMTEDDIDTAPVVLSVSTGSEPVYVILPMTVLGILAVGIVLIKKYVL